MGLFGGTLNAMTIANVLPNLPTITWAATLDPGHHSFSKWAIRRGAMAHTDQLHYVNNAQMMDANSQLETRLSSVMTNEHFAYT